MVISDRMVLISVSLYFCLFLFLPQNRSYVYLSIPYVMLSQAFILYLLKCSSIHHIHYEYIEIDLNAI